jgi:hypothetical protein
MQNVLWTLQESPDEMPALLPNDWLTRNIAITKAIQN